MKCKDCGGEMSPNEINSAGRHLVWATCFGVVQERERAALARAEAAITESNSAARRAFSAEVENQRLTKEAAGLRARVAELEAQLAGDIQDDSRNGESGDPFWYGDSD